MKTIDPDHALQLVLAAASAPHAVTTTPAAGSASRASLAASAATAAAEGAAQAVGAAPFAAVDVALQRALGKVLDEVVVADRDYPPFDRAMMDGFSVRVADAGRELPVLGEVAAGHVRREALPQGAVLAIMTGAVCPAGTEAVVPVEAVGHGDGVVRLPSAITGGQHVARRGSECRAGTAVLQPGDVITPLRLALLATVGRTTVRVRRPVTVAVITTGDELVQADRTPGPGQIRCSNGAMLAAMAELSGVRVVTRTHAGDDRAELLAALERSAEHDVVVLSGGVSAGRYDLVPEVIAAFGGRQVFHHVRQKPGGPLLFATRGRQLIFGLPGNPLAAQLGFHRYVLPAIRLREGHDPTPPGSSGRLTAPVTVRGSRTLFRLCRIARGGAGWQVTPLVGAGSADLFAAAAANALVRFEPTPLPHSAGTEVRFEWLGTPLIETELARPAAIDGGPDPGRLLAPIATRRSLRAFDARPVPDELLGRALDAARWAPSAGNGQPWRFVVAHRGGRLFDRLAATFRPNNAWARQAPCLLLSAAKEMHEHPEKPPKPNALALLEVGLALQNLIVQATADGLLAHPFDGFDAQAAGEAVGVPPGFRVAVLVVVGWPGDPHQLDQKTREKDARPRHRLPLEELVFEERWGQPPRLEAPELR